MNNKRKGTRNEHRSMALLEAEWYACTRAAASLGVFDIVAIGPHEVLLVQVKSNAWPSSAEMETIRKFRCPDNCKKIVHRWRDGARRPDIRVVSPTPKLELQTAQS